MATDARCSDGPADPVPAAQVPATPHPGLTTRFADGTMTLIGRIAAASNATFLAEVPSVDGGPVRAVYKPASGERPLWDFPDRTLGHREVGAYLLSELCGFHTVPYTTWVDGPRGPGSLQAWVDADEADAVVELVPSEDVHRIGGTDRVRYAGRDWYDVLTGYDERDREVTLLHADDSRLRSLAVFDAVINNADRKGGHIVVSGGLVFGVDHGISFHPENKLRTLLWGWAGAPLTDEELGRVELALQAADQLRDLLGDEDTDALRRRCRRLLRSAALPWPDPHRHTIPWPPW